MTAIVLTEKQFMAQVVELARTFGWHTFHPWLSIRSERGWPDLSMCRDGRLVFVELKTEKGKLTLSQEAWIERLGECVEAYVWRPSDWDDVVRILR